MEKKMKAREIKYTFTKGSLEEILKDHLVVPDCYRIAGMKFEIKYNNTSSGDPRDSGGPGYPEFSHVDVIMVPVMDIRR